MAGHGLPLGVEQGCDLVVKPVVKPRAGAFATFVMRNGGWESFAQPAGKRPYTTASRHGTVIRGPEQNCPIAQAFVVIGADARN